MSHAHSRQENRAWPGWLHERPIAPAQSLQVVLQGDWVFRTLDEFPSPMPGYRLVEKYGKVIFPGSTLNTFFRVILFLDCADQAIVQCGSHAGRCKSHLGLDGPTPFCNGEVTHQRGRIAQGTFFCCLGCKGVAWGTGQPLVLSNDGEEEGCQNNICAV